MQVSLLFGQPGEGFQVAQIFTPLQGVGCEGVEAGLTEPRDFERNRTSLARYCKVARK